jgi:60 kDa SS-A/Ro ribonucleoprotein
MLSVALRRWEAPVKSYLESFGLRETPQTESIPGETQVQNNAGGFVYALDKWATFHRFLIIGSEGGSYYVKEKELTVEAARNSLACIQEDGPRAVKLIVEISDAGRAPRNTPAEFALALAASVPDVETRRLALNALPQVCRIPTHLFHFVAFLKKNRGMGRAVRRALSDWYLWNRRNGSLEARSDIAHTLVKYQSRDGWSHRDVLRLAHPRYHNDPAFRWAVGAGLDARRVRRDRDGRHIDSYSSTSPLPEVIAAFEEAKTAPKSRLIELIATAGLTREMVPTESLGDPEVWEALLSNGMPLNALVRNLGNMSKVGLLKPMSLAAKTVVSRLKDAQQIKGSRIHPIALLIASRTYASGKGQLGKGAWTTVPQVVDALDEAFYLAFGNIQPTGKRFLYGLDVSGSMGWSGPVGITCAEGAAAMAMACIRSEEQYYVMGFADSFRDLGITKSMTLREVLKQTSRNNFGSTDCSLPMTWALEQKIPVDCFVVITDNETYAGRIHPSQALRRYREKMGVNAKEVVIGMTATNFTIADPNDPGTLDVAGFDAAVPQIVSEFARG